MTDDEREARLLSAAMQVDVIELAGRIIANPTRNAPAVSAAGAVALAFAADRFWEIALEAEVLAALVNNPLMNDDGSTVTPDPKASAQARRVAALMNALRGLNEEDTDNGHHND